MRSSRCRPRAAIGATARHAGLPGWPGRAAQPVGLVHHEEVDTGLRRAGRELRPRDERLQGDHGAPVDVEGVEVGAVVPRDVGQPGLVEQHEDLVVLPPQLAEPLHRQRLGRDHQAPLRPSRPDESAQDEAGLDRLAEPHLVGQQPAHGVGGGRALGGVELVGEEPDPPAEEGAEALGLSQRSEVQPVEPQGQVLDGVDVPGGQALHEVGPRVGRPGVVGRERHEGRSSLARRSVHAAGGELHQDRPALHGHARAPARAPGCGGASGGLRPSTFVHCCHSEEPCRARRRGIRRAAGGSLGKDLSFRGASSCQATRNPPSRRRIPRDPSSRNPSG